MEDLDKRLDEVKKALSKCTCVCGHISKAKEILEG
jgi:hypothetical protein